MHPRALLEKFEYTVSLLQSPLLLLIRFYWGLSFAQTGWGKLAHLERTTAYFTDLGLPLPKLNALAAGATECGCGVLLLVGLFSRIVSVPLIFVMFVAYYTADRDALKAIFNDTDKFVTATPFLFLYAALLVLVFGPGRFSFDHWLLGKKSAG
jgi:putative oxidoreductase